jgi:uncharacterized FlgJ-related protein
MTTKTAATIKWQRKKDGRCFHVYNEGKLATRFFAREAAQRFADKLNGVTPTAEMIEERAFNAVKLNMTVSEFVDQFKTSLVRDLAHQAFRRAEAILEDARQINEFAAANALIKIQRRHLES